MGKLTTHVLDLWSGRPAAGIGFELASVSNDSRQLLRSAVTNIDGRTDEPLLIGAELLVGELELTFFVAEYFARLGAADAGRFLTHVPIRFVVADAAANYHVPLLMTPWGYSTYRGS